MKADSTANRSIFKDFSSMHSNQYEIWLKPDFNNYLKSEGNFLNDFLMVHSDKNIKSMDNFDESLNSYEDEISYRAYMISNKSEISRK